MATSLGLERNMFPAFVVQAVINDQVFPFRPGRKITANAIDGFVLEILEGRGRPGMQGVDGEDGGGDGDREEGGESGGEGDGEEEEGWEEQVWGEEHDEL